MTLRKTSTERLKHHRILFQPYPQTDLRKLALRQQLIENSVKSTYIEGRREKGKEGRKLRKRRRRKRKSPEEEEEAWKE